MFTKFFAQRQDEKDWSAAEGEEEEGDVHAVRPSPDAKQLFTKQSPLLFIGCSFSISIFCPKQIDCVNHDRRSAKVWNNSDESFIGCSFGHQVSFHFYMTGNYTPTMDLHHSTIG